MTLTSSWLPIWLLPVLLAALTALASWLYRADRRSCGSLAGWTITSLRILLLAPAFQYTPLMHSDGSLRE